LRHRTPLAIALTAIVALTPLAAYPALAASTAAPGSASAGEVEVWIDGAKVATVDTRADETTHRQVVYAKGCTSYGTEVIK
jgi:hypothetical protein